MTALPVRALERNGVLTSSILLLALASAVASAACGRTAAAPQGPPPPEVEVATVLQRDVPVFVEAIGQTRGGEEVEVRARVEGYLDSVEFQEGSYVRKGQRLYTIDPREYEAAVAQAKARVAQSEADLARNEQDVARYQPLVEQNAYPKQNLDTAVALVKAGRANVEAARAALTSVELNLAYTKIFAPTDGIIGKTEVNVGNFVGRGQPTLLTHISKLQNIDVRFTLPEAEYLHLARRREEIVTPSLELVLADGSIHPEKGRMVFVDRNVDPTTGTMMMEATFPNPGAIVRPGQYARVRASVETKSGAILVPQRAVTELQGIYNVAVVKPDDTVEIRVVTPGQRVANLWVIDAGLKPGDRIIVEGVQKVRPGVKVKPQVGTIRDAVTAEPASAVPSTGTTAAKE